MDGMREEAARFETDVGGLLAGTPFEGLARYRTFGEDGPMYQVLALRGDRVLVWLSVSDEEVEILAADARADPMAQ